MALKAGTRLQSQVCSTEVMVIKCGDVAAVECGGHAMSDTGQDVSGSIEAGFADGTQVGKRYVNESQSLELLCVKAEDGSLSVDGTKLSVKESKQLPSSD